MNRIWTQILIGLSTLWISASPPSEILQWGRWQGEGHASAQTGFTTNVFYENSEPKFDFPLEGSVELLGDLSLGHFKILHESRVPFAVFPTYSNQNFWSPQAGASVHYSRSEEVKIIGTYEYQMDSYPALSRLNDRQDFQTHRIELKSQFQLVDLGLMLDGTFQFLRPHFERAYDHQSHRQMLLELILGKWIMPETLINFGLEAKTYRFDQPQDSKWLKVMLGFEGTLMKKTSIEASLGLQLKSSDQGRSVYEPSFAVWITESSSQTRSFTLGFESQLEQTFAADHMRESAFFMNARWIFFDSWILYGKTEYVMRNHTGPIRTDHFIGLTARIEYPFHAVLSAFAQWIGRFNNTGTLAPSLVAGDDRFASYVRTDFFVGLTARVP